MVEKIFLFAFYSHLLLFCYCSSSIKDVKVPVKEAGSDSLPEWLDFDKETESIYGVPNPWENLIIPRYHISIVAHGQYAGRKSEKVFTITVVEDGSPSNGNSESFRNALRLYAKNAAGDFSDQACRFNGPVYSVVIFPVFHYRSLSIKEKVEYLQRLAELSNLNTIQVRLLDTNFLKDFADYHLLKSFTPATSDLVADQPCILFIVGCPDDRMTKNSHDNFRNRNLSPLVGKILDSISQKSGEHNDSLRAILIESRLYNRKTSARRRRENLVLPQVQEFFSTPEVELTTSTSAPATTTTTIITPTVTKSTRARPPSTTEAAFYIPTTKPTTEQVTETSPTMTTESSSSISRRTSRDTSRVTSFTKRQNERPIVQHSLDSFSCYQNMLCIKEIDKDTFRDKEDGNTRRLRLKLSTIKKPADAQHNFLMVKGQRELMGVPLDVGRWEMQLTATDKAGNSANDVFAVNVEPKNVYKTFNHEFLITLNTPYTQFTSNVEKFVSFVKRLAQHLGDSDTNNVRINSISPIEEKVLIRWSNASLLDKSCPKQQVDVLFKMQQLTLFRDRMNPNDFPFVSVIREFSKECDGRSSLTPVKFPSAGVSPIEPTTETTASPLVTRQPDSGGVGQALSANLFLATILPIIIIAFLLCVAVAVACVLFGKSRRSKKHSSLLINGGDPRSDFVSKGAPVIFPDEVDHMDEDLVLKSVSHVPMLLKDEKPPLAPPDFSNQLNAYDSVANALPANSCGSKSQGPFSEQSYYPAGYQSPLSVGRQVKKPPTTLDETEMATKPLLQDFDENPLYRAPPPFEPSGLAVKHHDGRSPRPKHASPQQREPPPYVPP